MKSLKRFIYHLYMFATEGIFIGLVISIICNYLSRNSTYLPSDPSFTSKFSNSLDAFTVSVILWAVTGALFGFGSFIFSISQWSVLKKTIVNFFAYYLGFVPLALLAGWVPLNLINLSKFTVVFILIYIIIWYCSYHKAVKDVKSINQKIKEK